MNRLPGRHRTIIDCATVSGAGEGMLYANNLFVANRSGYQLNEGDIAVVVCLRHFATVFAYNDAIWSKYGQAISSLVQFVDPKTKQAPASNLLNSPDYGMALPNFGNSIPSVVKRGTHFAVCEMATQFITGQVAAAVKADAQALFKEFSASLIPNSHLVSAGVVAVNRAQEYGYTLLTAL
jgi:intracellular sulfur oxidation DsrE/DsrF family protein